MRKYVQVALVTAQSTLAYPLDTVARAGFMAVVIFVFAQLWTVTYHLSGRTNVGGFDLRQMIWYLVFTETIIMSCPRVFTKIDQDVKSGDLAYTINRPYNYALFQYASFLGSGLLAVPINFAVGGALAWLMAGPPNVGAVVWPALAVAIGLAMTLNFVVELLIGLLAFWFEDTYAFFWIFQKTVFTLGGLFLPLDAFPSALREIATRLPFTSIAYGPARLTVDFQPSAFVATVGTQLFWIAVLGVGAATMFRRGIRRVNVNGG